MMKSVKAAIALTELLTECEYHIDKELIYNFVMQYDDFDNLIERCENCEAEDLYRDMIGIG